MQAHRSIRMRQIQGVKIVPKFPAYFQLASTDDLVENVRKQSTACVRLAIAHLALHSEDNGLYHSEQYGDLRSVDIIHVLH
jgi:hypothetical protein